MDSKERQLVEDVDKFLDEKGLSPIEMVVICCLLQGWAISLDKPEDEDALVTGMTIGTDEYVSNTTR